MTTIAPLQPRGAAAEDLATLARRIRDREQTIAMLKRATVDKANETIVEVILQGHDLAEAKAKCEAGTWLNWLAIHAPEISERTAQRYMAIAARAPHVADLGEAGSLRHALALCELEGAGDKPEPKRWPYFTEGLQRLGKWTGFLARHPLATWPIEATDKAREDLEPVARALWPDRFA